MKTFVAFAAKNKVWTLRVLYLVANGAEVELIV